MSTDPYTISPSDLSSPTPFSGVQKSQQGMRHECTASSQSGSGTNLYDPKWVFAMRVRLILESDASMEPHNMIEQGARSGLNPMQSRLVIGIVERALERGGLDSVAHQELDRVPSFNIEDGIAVLSTRSRWLVFGALFAWALGIAGLMQLVA